MENKRQYFRNIEAGDVEVTGRKSNGITVKANGSTILYSGVKEDQLQDFIENQYEGTVDVDGFNGNIIAIMKPEQEIQYPVGNDNNETYIDTKTTSPNKITTQQLNNNNVDCANEFDDVAEALLKTAALHYDDFEISGNNINQPAVTNKSKIDKKKFEKAKKLLLDYFWNENKSKRVKEFFTGLFQETQQLISSNPDKYIVSKLPPGWRELFLWKYFTWQDITPSRFILGAVGPNGLNAKDKNGNSLGIPYEQITVFYDDLGEKIQISDADGNLTDDILYHPDITPNIPSGAKVHLSNLEAVKIYINNFSEILNIYNNNKTQFLEELKKVYIRYINESYNKIKKISKIKPIDLKGFKKNYDYQIATFNAVYDVAVKYKDCSFTPVITGIPTGQTSTNQEQKPPIPAPPLDLEFLPEDSEDIFGQESFTITATTIEEEQAVFNSPEYKEYQTLKAVNAPKSRERRGTESRGSGGGESGGRTYTIPTSGNLPKPPLINVNDVSIAKGTGDGTWERLNENILRLFSERANWKESSTNQVIINMFKEIGMNTNAGKTQWCGSFVNYVLKISGFDYIYGWDAVPSANLMAYGTEVPIDDPSKWRQWDILILYHTNDPTTGHVGFVNGVKGSGNNADAGEQASIVGGNQSNALTIGKYPYRGSDFKIRGVRRGAWTPPDTPLPLPQGAEGLSTY